MTVFQELTNSRKRFGFDQRSRMPAEEDGSDIEILPTPIKPPPPCIELDLSVDEESDSENETVLGKKKAKKSKRDKENGLDKNCSSEEPETLDGYIPDQGEEDLNSGRSKRKNKKNKSRNGSTDDSRRSKRQRTMSSKSAEEESREDLLRFAQHLGLPVESPSLNLEHEKCEETELVAECHEKKRPKKKSSDKSKRSKHKNQNNDNLQDAAEVCEETEEAQNTTEICEGAESEEMRVQTSRKKKKSRKQKESAATDISNLDNCQDQSIETPNDSTSSTSRQRKDKPSRRRKISDMPSSEVPEITTAAVDLQETEPNDSSNIDKSPENEEGPNLILMGTSEIPDKNNEPEARTEEIEKSQITVSVHENDNITIKAHNEMTVEVDISKLIRDIYPLTWTPEMKIYYGESTSEINELLIKSRQSDNKRHWRADKDINPRCISSKIRCYNCLQKGHHQSNCVERVKGFSCRICGDVGHRDGSFCCPNAICLVCGKKVSKQFTYDCQKCQELKKRDKHCSICGMAGHVDKYCPDHWRRYYLCTDTKDHGKKLSANDNNSTSGDGSGIKKQIYRRKYQSWCANCGRKGHNYFGCTKSRITEVEKYYDYTIPNKPFIIQELQLFENQPNEDENQILETEAESIQHEEITINDNETPTPPVQITINDSPPIIIAESRTSSDIEVLLQTSKSDESLASTRIGSDFAADENSSKEDVPAVNIMEKSAPEAESESSESTSTTNKPTKEIVESGLRTSMRLTELPPRPTPVLAPPQFNEYYDVDERNLPMEVLKQVPVLIGPFSSPTKEYIVVPALSLPYTTSSQNSNNSYLTSTFTMPGSMVCKSKQSIEVTVSSSATNDKKSSCLIKNDEFLNSPDSPEIEILKEILVSATPAPVIEQNTNTSPPLVQRTEDSSKPTSSKSRCSKFYHVI